MHGTVVIGAGAIGLCAAHYLHARGHAVTVLERAHVAAGASFGNCGLISPSHAAPLTRPGMAMRGLLSLLQPGAPFRIAPRFDTRLFGYLWQFRKHCSASHFEHALACRVPLLNRSRQLIEALIDERRLDCEFTAAGTLTCFLSSALLEQELGHLEALRRFGIEHELLSRAEVHRRVPGLRPRVIGGLYARGDAHLHPGRFMAALAESLTRDGVPIREGVAVQGLRAERGRVAALLTSQGAIDVERVVLACGVWSRELAREAGVEVPMVPGKGYSITLPVPEGAPTVPVWLRDASVMITPWSERIRIGSTMEFTGFDERQNPVRLTALARGWARFLETPLPAELGQRWAGLRPMVADELPVIGKAPKLRNLLLCFGHGMLGMSMCAATGEAIADLADGEAPKIDITPFSPARFR